MYNILANLKNGGEPQKSNKINASLHSPPFSFLIIHIKSISTAYSQNCCQRCFIFSHSNSPQPLIYRGFPSFPTSSRMDSRLDVFLSNILRFHTEYSLQFQYACLRFLQTGVLFFPEKYFQKSCKISIIFGLRGFEGLRKGTSEKITRFRGCERR